MAGRGYGIANYDTGLYGVTTYIDAVATGTASASVSAVGGEVFYGDALISASSTTASAGVFVIEGAANTIQGTSSLASAAVEVFDGLASMGGSAVGSTGSGTRVREVSATSSASASLTASLQFITNASGSTACSASTTAACIRARLADGSITGLSGFDASANITAVGEATPQGQASVSINYIRERSVAANAIQGVSAFASVDGREKWEPISYTPITWSEIAA